MKLTGKKIGRLVTAALLSAFLLSGCAGAYGVEQTEDTRTPVDENLIVVGVSQVGSESVWRTANTASLQRIFTKENGYFLIFNRTAGRPCSRRQRRRRFR